VTEPDRARAIAAPPSRRARRDGPTARGTARPETASLVREADASLLDVIDNVLNKGVVLSGDVVLGVQKRPDEDHEPFETVIHAYKHEKYHADIEDSRLTAEDQQELVARFKTLVKERTGKVFPNDPWDQLRGAAGAVFGSWMNDRAIVYRRKYNIPSEWGTAVNVQAMVYGNTGDKSGSGVAFTPVLVGCGVRAISSHARGNKPYSAESGVRTVSLDYSISGVLDHVHGGVWT